MSGLAAVQEATGYLCLMAGQIKLAEQHFDVVRSIYRSFYAEEPKRLTAKEDEIYQAFVQTGINIAKTISKRNK